MHQISMVVFHHDVTKARNPKDNHIMKFYATPIGGLLDLLCSNSL